MKGMHLAELNVARLGFAPEDARVAPFMRALHAVNGIAERSDGFVWRFVAHTAAGDVPEETGDPRLIPNLSVWEGVVPLVHFVWTSVHRQFHARRGEGFELLEGMHFAMWWVAPGEEPTMEAAMARLAHLGPMATVITRLAGAGWRQRSCGARRAAMGWRLSEQRGATLGRACGRGGDHGGPWRCGGGRPRRASNWDAGTRGGRRWSDRGGFGPGPVKSCRRLRWV